DITEKRKTQEALQISETRFKNVAQHSRTVIWEIDRTGLYTYVNNIAEAVYGYTPDELIGKKYFYDLHNEGGREALRLMGEELLDNGQPINNFDNTILKKDGGIIWVSSNADPIYDKDNHIVGYGGSDNDITERKKAEDELRIFRTISDQANYGASIADIAGNLIYLNDEYARIHGWTKEELLGKNISVLYNNEQIGRIQSLLKQEREEGGFVAQEVWRIKKDGTVFPTLMNGKLIMDIKGRPLYTSATVIDITRQKQAEQDRIARAAAEEANRAKSVFLSNMSHEIRTPMNAIIGFAQILNRDPSLKPRQTEHVRTILRSSEHLIGLINDILDLSRIEAGYTKLNNKAFSLRDLLDDMQRMFGLRAGEKGLQLYIEGQEELPGNVIADEAKLRQVLINLIGNAIKFTVAGGVGVRLSAKKTDVDELALAVEVEDTGPGISEEDKKQIFNSFWQTEEGQKAGGTGLGLAISKNLVELMGGRLTVENRQGYGSIFRFCIPVRPWGKLEKKHTEIYDNVVGLEPDSGPFRILIVDDIKDNRELLLHMVEPVGFEVMEAADGQRALELLGGWSPHCILVDTNMPVMDGYETVRKIKCSEKGSSTLVIVVSSSAFESDVERVMLCGADAFLSKPFRVEELFSLLGRIPGLRYIFNRSPMEAAGNPGGSRLAREELDVLPEALVHKMRQAVLQGNMMKLRELIDQVERIDVNVAQRLQALVRQYDYDKLGRLFEAKGG
ncbi:MAG TPA: PAS domain S-box protein, partial [Negativicutes bacterium]|nr:PAS domain S-box protein [Negativicutes bacterium]